MIIFSNSQQMVPTKLIKSEPISAKDIKTEPGHPMHANKEQQPPGPQSLGPRYLFIYDLNQKN